VQRLTISIGDAGQGVKSAQDGLARLGFSFQELSVMAPEDQFRAVVRRHIDNCHRKQKKQLPLQTYLAALVIELLPLFASNLEEVEARAQRLGIILSGEQTGAIEKMNDALSLVYQTFEGIIGQVTANLAPIVSSIAEEFLSFVEAFQGFGGEGGSGIADALTEGLLDFAEYMASIFDAVVSELLSFGETMQVVSAIFEFVANTFVAVSETLRAIFNVFEMVGNTIMLGLGKSSRRT
jgi:phage-related protein